MSCADLGDEPAVAWSIDGARFEMQVYKDTAAFFHPDGQVIEMSSREWTLLARAIGLLMGQHQPPDAASVSKSSTKPKAGKSGRRWTEQDDANLLDRWAKGDTVNDLMTLFDRNEGGVTSRLVRLRVAQNRDEILAESRKRRQGRLSEEQKRGELR